MQVCLSVKISCWSKHTNIHCFFRLAVAMISNVKPKLRLKLYHKLSTFINIDGYGKYFNKTDPCKKNVTCTGI